MRRSKDRIITHKIQMPNGIRLLVREDHSSPLIALAAYFLGGRRATAKGKAGVASLTQRLTTKGAGGLDAISLAEELEFHGISATPFFGFDTAGIKMLSLSRHFDRALDLFHKMLTQPTFSEEEFEKEKVNLLDDIKKEKDDVLGYCMQMCEELVFEGHPYGLPSNGTLETVKKLKRQDVVDYHQSVFCPSRMVIALVGDIKPDEAERKLERLFADFEQWREAPDPGAIKGPIKNVKEQIEYSEKQQVAICMGFHAPPVSDEDYYTFYVLNQVLSGMGARLFVELRDKQGLAYLVNSRYHGLYGGGLFQVYILTSFHHKEKARIALLEEVDRLRTRLVSYDELVRAKRHHLGLFDISLQSKSSVASKIAYHELMGMGHDYIENYSERIKRITRQKVKRAAEKYLKPQSYAIALLTPATFPKIPQ